MKTLNALAILTAATISMTIAPNAKADLNGTTIDLSVTHAGGFGAFCPVANEVYIYGMPAVYTPAGWTPLVVTSPEFTIPGYDNTVTLDFTLFQYNSVFMFAPAIGTAKFLDIADAFDIDSVQVLTNGLGGVTDITLSPATLTGNGFKVSWDTTAVLAVNMQTPNVTIAWNNAVPAPGPLALLGCAGIIAGRRRRRS